MSSKLALILSGGGARGAYEVGILKWIAENRPRLLERVKIITGSSVGAINAAYLASHGVTPESVQGLAQIWSTLKVDSLIGFSLKSAVGSVVSRSRNFLHQDDARHMALLNTEGYERLIREGVDWKGLTEVTESGRLDGVAITATAIQNGQTHVFVQRAPDTPIPNWPSDESMVGWDGPIHPKHVIASASLPFLFPPVRIGKRWYCDGGLRQNTPLSPALRLGADQLFAISVKKSPQSTDVEDDAFPGFGILLGKLLNSIFLDRLLWDLDRLNRINVVLECAEEVGGAEFLPRMREALVKRGRRPYSRVNYVGIRPSEDIGGIAARLLKRPEQLHSNLSFLVRKILSGGRSGVSDAASYLLFDGAFAHALIDLGTKDAAGYTGAIDAILKG